MERRVFLRDATGLVKEMSLFDLAWWGICGSGGLYLLFYFMPYAQYYLPGADLGLSIILCLIVMIPLYLLYAGLGSSMPRTGGDYVFESRILHPAIGFAFPFAWFTVVWVAVFVAFGGFVIASLGLAPVFLLLGALQNNSTFLGWAGWLQGATGIFVVSAITGLLSLLITVYPMSWWVKSQRFVFFPFTMISVIVMTYLLGTATTSSFHDAFNYWGNLMGSPGLYESVVNATSTPASGYVTPAFSWSNTMILMAVISIYIAWTMWGSQSLLSEVKRAGDFRRLFTAYLGAGLFVQWIVLYLPIALFSNVVGWDFTNRLANAYYLPSSVVPFYPTVGLLVSMLTTNPVLIVLVSLGIIAGGFFIAASEYVAVTRIWLAMAMDRILPAWFGSVNSRTHTPVYQTLLCCAISLIAAYLFNFWPPFYSVITVGSVMGPTGVVFITAIAAILFRKRLRVVFDQSPMSRYKLGPVYLIEVVGVVAAIVAFAIDTIYLTAPQLGYNTPVPIAITFGLLIISVIYFYARSSHLKSKGIDIKQVFNEIPPE
ncbi:MAG TPA: amino acid permease [Candidatus Bathyarchaeia archaeon]|nr:amino acid permease [Candidatus Bathyarchaeia archaeon]